MILAVGGGIGDPERAGEYLLTGTWSQAYGSPAMPVDGDPAGHRHDGRPGVGCLGLGEGGPGRCPGACRLGDPRLDRRWDHLRAHQLGRRHPRDRQQRLPRGRLLDEVAGDADAVADRRDEIIEAMSATAKPYFGDVAEMTYAELLERYVALSALGRHGRYEDGAWLDPTHRARFLALLQRAEARLNPVDSGPIATLFADPASTDDPGAAVAALVQAHPAARTALLHPADVAHFRTVARMPGKPVPFVPVLDADVRRWYQSDSLWQSHSDLYDADQVLHHPRTDRGRWDQPGRRARGRSSRPLRDHCRVGPGRRGRGRPRARRRWP